MPSEVKETSEQNYLTYLRETLTTRFHDEELRTLCFDLGVDYASLPGDGKEAKARELVAYLHRRKIISDLIRVGKRQRPDVELGNPLEINSAASSMLPSSTPLMHLVTNLEYLNFVRSSGHRAPCHWYPTEPFFAHNQSNTPVTGVSWNDAVAYCDWMGGCLPDMNDAEPLVGDLPEIGEWRDAGDEQEKWVCSFRTSRLIMTVDREVPRQDVGFRCTPARPVPIRKWVYIDGGQCQLGTDIPKFSRLADIHQLPFTLRKPILNRPVKPYNVPGFKISTTCVTNEEYYEFTQATGKKWPEHWDSKWLSRSSRPFPARLAPQPVIYVSAEDAQSYCIWSRTRLPKWLEWERAASGLVKQAYPWGTNYGATYCNSVESGRGSLAAVDEYPLGDSPERLRQLCGNVSEWVISPDGRFEIRGGSYRMHCEVWGLAYAFCQTELGFRALDIGFRVVID